MRFNILSIDVFRKSAEFILKKAITNAPAKVICKRSNRRNRWAAKPSLPGCPTILGWCCDKTVLPEYAGEKTASGGSDRRERFAETVQNESQIRRRRHHLTARRTDGASHFQRGGRQVIEYKKTLILSLNGFLFVFQTAVAAQNEQRLAAVNIDLKEAGVDSE
jgi:hypothetical protein